MTGALPASSPAIRIHQGETIVCMAWSNTATQLWGLFRVVYDDGNEEDFILNRTLLLNNRVQGQLVTGTIAHRNGYVVSGQICQVSGVANQAVQRGQCFVRAMVVTDVGQGTAGVSSAACRATLCTGYVYSGMDVPLGSFVEPGPAGGPGNQRVISLSNPAAGVEFTTVGVPAGALWKLRTFQATLVAAAVAVNRKPVLSYDDGTNVFVRTTPGGVAQTGQTVQFSGAIGMAPTDTNDTASLAGDTIGWALPDCFIIGGGDISFLTLNLQGTDDWGLGFIQVEEWVMPN